MAAGYSEDVVRRIVSESPSVAERIVANPRKGTPQVVYRALQVGFRKYDPTRTSKLKDAANEIFVSADPKDCFADYTGAQKWLLPLDLVNAMGDAIVVEYELPAFLLKTMSSPKMKRINEVLDRPPQNGEFGAFERTEAPSDFPYVRRVFVFDKASSQQASTAKSAVLKFSGYSAAAFFDNKVPRIKLGAYAEEAVLVMSEKPRLSLPTPGATAHGAGPLPRVMAPFPDAGILTAAQRRRALGWRRPRRPAG